MPPIAGQLVSERFDYDGGRVVTAYVPSAAPEAIVFAGDGQLITSWVDVLETADLPATMIVGAHRLDDETLRIQEYSPGASTLQGAFLQTRLGVPLAAYGHPGSGDGSDASLADLGSVSDCRARRRVLR